MSDQTLDTTLKALRMPGATLATRLKVYDTPTPDGQIGGTPHMHLLCTEMYFVIGGNGAVQFLDMGGFSIQELAPQTAVIFSPGTIHRLINPNRDLELFIIMQNSGLPERGDNVVTFSDAIMQSDDAYAEAMTVQTLDEAYRRRDRGVEGFLQLKTAFEESPEQGQQALQRFYDRAADCTQPLRREWREIVTQGALAEAQTALANLDALEEKQTDYLADARQFAIQPQAYSKLGFCGHLNRYFDPATLTPEGIITE
jgi:mannose-6-phosphate isomerase-like protein (cupin superfamily)